MQFADHSSTQTIAGKPVKVRVTAAALHALWGAHSGPQNAAGLVERYRAVIDAIVAERYAAGDHLDGEIVIRDVELDM